MTDKAKQSLAWAAAAVWMVVIFLLSAQTNKESGDLSGGIVRWVVALFYRNFEAFSLEKQESVLEVWHLLIRKGAHFTEYAVLCVLVANALRLCRKLHWYLPVAISAAYAVTDEIHQYFVPGRACRLLDMGIDTCGAIFGMVVFALCAYVIKKIKSRGVMK